MERRKAVIAAATVSLTLLSGAAAIGLNTGIVGASGDDGVGQISPVDTATTPDTIYIDEPAASPATAPSRHGEDDDRDDIDRDEDDAYEEDVYEDDDDHDDDDHEYEGADDDD
ncbi:MAG TPA: hypothetical protein VFY82_11245 [Acidimicrobiales bacterium]|nr:hypothetical protein [Acidimicrobiales bacterium]